MSAPAVETRQATLNAKHRCDACSSRAFVATFLRASDKLPEGGELLWCAHHWRANADALMPYLFAIVDETSQLTEHVRDDGHIN